MQAAWYPADVIADGQKTLYTPLTKANQAWRICALLPHGKDQYWWGVAFGLSQEAERQGVTLGIYDAGGYDKIEQQKQQLHDCYALKAQAYIIAANTADGLIADIEQLSAAGIPVIDLVNGIATDKLTSRSLVSFEEMSVAATEYIAAQQREAINQDSPKLKVAWFPGPKGASWVMAAEQGFRQAAGKQAFEVIEGGYGTTELFVQADLVRKVLAKQSVDYVIANAVAATFAARFLDGRRNQTGKVIAFYSNAQTIELVQKKQLLATVSDSPVLQAQNCHRSRGARTRRCALSPQSEPCYQGHLPRQHPPNRFRTNISAGKSMDDPSGSAQRKRYSLNQIVRTQPNK
ncbi:TMAO reductase system periplasmic protein TorT [Shewanella baltica]